jgi:hypothetical protein
MLPRESYLYPTGYTQIATEQDEHYALDMKEGERRGWIKQTPSADGQTTTITLVPNMGVFMPVKDAMFPLKCYAEANAVFSANLIKAYIIENVKLLAKWYMIPFLLLLNKQKALDAFNRIAMKSFSPYLLKDNCLTDFGRTLKQFLIEFLFKLGFTSESTQTFAVIMANLIDLDNAYRLRFEDTLSETTVEKLQNPRKEIRRLLMVMKDREIRPGVKGQGIHNKFKVFAYLLSLAMLIPRVKRAFLSALNILDFKKFQLDDIDTYWLCMRCDYKWMGLTDTERKSYAQSKGWTYPNPMVN